MKLLQTNFAGSGLGIHGYDPRTWDLFLVLQKDKGTCRKSFNGMRYFSCLTKTPAFDTVICKKGLKWHEILSYKNTSLRHSDLQKRSQMTWDLVLQKHQPLTQWSAEKVSNDMKYSCLTKTTTFVTVIFRKDLNDVRSCLTKTPAFDRHSDMQKRSQRISSI